MTMPQNNREVLVIKQGGQVPQYDEDSRQIFTCLWEEVEHLRCVDHMPVGRFSDVTTVHKLESSDVQETFYFSLHNQSHNCDFDIKHGYYILQRLGVKCNYYACPEDVGWAFWKVVGVKTFEILPGCWDIKLTAQRLAGRESEQLLIECKPYIKQLQGVLTKDHGN